MTPTPCKICGMSPRNSIHKNPKQFDHHEWVEVSEKEPTEKRFCICADESGHEYYIPVDQVGEFDAWVRATENGDFSGEGFDDSRIDGHFTFTDPRRD